MHKLNFCLVWFKNNQIKLKHFINIILRASSEVHSLPLLFLLNGVSEGFVENDILRELFMVDQVFFNIVNDRWMVFISCVLELAACRSVYNVVRPLYFRRSSYPRSLSRGMSYVALLCILSSVHVSFLGYGLQVCIRYSDAQSALFHYCGYICPNYFKNLIRLQCCIVLRLSRYHSLFHLSIFPLQFTHRIFPPIS